MAQAHIPYSRVLWRDIDWPAVLAGRIQASCYYMRSGLVRKDLLRLYAGEDAPKTVVVTEFAAVASALARSAPSDLWVLKKAAGSNASGIMFLRAGTPTDELSATVGECFHASGEAQPAWILQRYVIPATVKGRKFHIRVPVLAVGALDVYVHTNCRVIRASDLWRPTDFDHTFVHVTNLNVNCKHPEYDPWEQNFNLWALEKSTALNVWGQVCRLLCRLFATVARNRRHFLALPNCYELFGVDVAVTDTGRVLLLEVNPDPGLSMFHVMPPTGSVTPGSMRIELRPDCHWPSLVSEDSDDDDEFQVPVPPPGHLSIPSMESPFGKTKSDLIRGGYMRIASLTTVPIPGDATMDGDIDGDGSDSEVTAASQ